MSASSDQRVALVTGGTSGIGKAVAVAFAESGARVVITGRRQDAGDAAIRAIEAAGGQGLFVRGDVADRTAVRRAVDACVSEFGGLDWALNNAGISGAAWSAAAEYPEDAWDEIIAINLTGVFLAMKYELQVMVEAGHGAIVNMASVAGLTGTPGGVGYVASKHGIVGMTKAAALDHARQNIRINAVAPAVIRTEMLDAGIEQNPGLVDDMLPRHPIGRFGELDEVAQAVLWLCSDAASFVTGSTLTVDGGYTIR